MVVRAHGKFFAVQELGGDRLLLATPRGAIKRYRQQTDLVAVGDRVLVTELEDKEGRIETVLPRKSALERPARGSTTVQQVILANPDQALFVFAVDKPEPHRRMLDRFLILAESRGIPALVGVNKIDLDCIDPESGVLRSRAIFGDYEGPYPVLYLSATHGKGLKALAQALEGKLTVVAGPSGVGKSSLLNALDPDLQRDIQRISEATGKGRHTTTTAEIFRIGFDTYVADTPGIRALAMHGVPEAELEQAFPEFRPRLGRCFYADCRHLGEPGCAVLEAVEHGDIPRERYESYAALRRGQPD
jgi:ribosome biogenesis GTPase